MAYDIPAGIFHFEAVCKLTGLKFRSHSTISENKTYAYALNMYSNEMLARHTWVLFDFDVS